MRLWIVAAGLAAALSWASGARAEATYVGDQECLSCHDDVHDGYVATIHGKLFNPENGRTEAMRHGCEGCHGPGSEHAQSDDSKFMGSMLTFSAKDAKSIEQENAVCLSCHRNGVQLHWDGSPHAMRDNSCTNCHNVMKNVSQKHMLAKATEIDTCGTCHAYQTAKIFRNGHMPLRGGAIPDRDGKMSCSSCHNPHGTVTDKLINASTVNENCYKCHADKRGPFLWEHAPVTENCLNCHNPHGSPRPYMLIQSPPRLCQQCHDPTRHPTDPYRPTSKFVIGAACLNCHVNIHGSNHPSGEALTR